MRTKLIVKLMSTLETEDKVSKSDLFCLVNQPADKSVEVHFQEEMVQLVLISPGKILLLWPYPPQLIDVYDFCPDQRVLTHRLLGKPALGLSPPGRFLLPENNNGFVYSRESSKIFPTKKNT